MALVLVSSVEWAIGPNGGASVALDTTGANLLVVSVSWYAGGGGTPTVSDSKGNTWIGLTARVFAAVGHRFWYATTPTVGTGHTFTVSGTSIYPYSVALAYSGAHLTTPFDVENGATAGASAGPLATGSITPATDGALIVSGWVGMNGTSAPAVGSGLTLRQWSNPVASVCVAGAAADLVQVTAAAINPSWSWTGSDTTAAAVAAFAPAAAVVAAERVALYVWLPV